MRRSPVASMASPDSVSEAEAARQGCWPNDGDDVESRKHFIQTNADDVRFLDI